MNKCALCLIAVLLNTNFVTAAVTKDDPFYSVGTDFLILTPGNDDHGLMCFFNNTNIYVDIENDGVWDYKYLYNATQDLGLSYSVSTLIKAGTRVRSDKPIVYNQNRNVIPDISRLSNEYYVYGDDIDSCNNCNCGYFTCGSSTPKYLTYYVVSPENIKVYVDLNNTGVDVLEVNVSKLQRSEIKVRDNDMVRIHSDKPFYLYNKYTAVGPEGQDFYTITSRVEKLVITQDNTVVQVDSNNDGNYDNTTTYNKGVYGYFDINNGAHIHANKSIVVFYNWYFYAPRQDETGSDMWHRRNPQARYVSQIGVFDNTSCSLDDVRGNDLTAEYTTSLTNGQEKTFQDIGINYANTDPYHIWCNQPSAEVGNNGENILAYSTIGLIQYSKQKYLGANELTTMEVRLFNPFADTNITNVSFSVPFPNSFALASNQVTIEKRWLRNDTLIENDTITVSATTSGSNKVFGLNEGDSTLLSLLDPMQYYIVNYQLTTPSVLGTYTFDPVNFGYDAETWNMPEST